MSAHAQGGPRAGSLAEEAGRLVEALQQAAARWTPSADAAGAAAGDDPGPGVGAPADGDPDATACSCGRARDDRAAGHVPAACRVCPVCQAVARVQQVRPEVVQHLAEAAASLVAALTELAREQQGPSGGTGGRPDVQHIDISD